MKIKIMCPLWGHEHLPLQDILPRIKEAGYDGVDTWLFQDETKDRELHELLQELELELIAHQWQAEGSSFDEFKTSYKHFLNYTADANPLLINSHSGKDFFTFEQNCELIEISFRVSDQRGLRIAHETHRGRFPFSPGVTKPYFDKYPDLRITADLSHWCCVSESFLEGFAEVVEEALKRTDHVHARVGYTQSAQVPDPRVSEWKHATKTFLGWWDRIVECHRTAGNEYFTFTTEFGPAPYMVNNPKTGEPVASQWDINCYMKDLLRNRYSDN